MLRANGIVPERFEEDLREDLLLAEVLRPRQGLRLVPESELLREFAARNDKATIEYILVPASPSGDQRPARPTPDLQAYLEKHKDRYRAPVQRQIKYLLLDRAKVRARIQPTDAEIQAEYEKAQGHPERARSR